MASPLLRHSAAPHSLPGEGQAQPFPPQHGPPGSLLPKKHEPFLDAPSISHLSPPLPTHGLKCVHRAELNSNVTLFMKVLLRL